MAIVSVFSAVAPGVPAQGLIVIPSDATVLSPPTRGLYVGVSGDIAVIMNDGSGPFTLKAVPVGMLSISVIKIMATNTTATNIIGMR